MNTTDRQATADEFEVMLRSGLDRLAAGTPTSRSQAFDPDALPVASITTTQPRRWSPYLVPAAAAAILLVALVAIPRADDSREQQPAAPPTDASPATTPDQTPPQSTAPESSTLSTIPVAVRGTPICGAELPVTIDLSTATSGPNPGPAVYGPTAVGQFAQHWELPAGTIEVRWPADARELYDLETPRVRGNPTVFDGMTVGVPEDGSQAMIDVPNLGGARLTMTTGPAAADLSAPCDVLQVRFIDRDGNQTTRGYNVTDFTSGPTFGLDLNPLVTSTHAGVAPDPATVVTCGEGDVDTDVLGGPSPTAAEALLAFLDSRQIPGLMTSGYSEFTMSDSETVYAIIIDDRLITHITVARTPDGWTVSHVRAPGC